MSPFRRSIITILALTTVGTLCLDTVAFAQGPRARARKLTADLAAHRGAITGADAKAALASATALGTIKDARALETLLDALALGLPPDVAAAALTSIATHADARALDTVLFFTRYRDAAVRAAAIAALGVLNERRTMRNVIMALSDSDEKVRATAIGIVAQRNVRTGIEPMLELLKKGEEATVPALASMADANLAKVLGEYIGEAPNPLLANTLGAILLRKEFGPDSARVQVVKILGKISGPESMLAMRKYIDSLPAASLLQSKRQAEATIKDRLTGGQPAPKGAKKP